MTAPQNINIPIPSTKPMIKPSVSTITGKPLLRERFYDALDAVPQSTADDVLSPEDARELELMIRSIEPPTTGFLSDSPLEVKFYRQK